MTHMKHSTGVAQRATASIIPFPCPAPAAVLIEYADHLCRIHQCLITDAQSVAEFDRLRPRMNRAANRLSATDNSLVAQLFREWLVVEQNFQSNTGGLIGIAAHATFDMRVLHHRHQLADQDTGIQQRARR